MTFAAALLTALPSALDDGPGPLAPLRPPLFPVVVVFESRGPLEASDLESSATVVVRCCRGGAINGRLSRRANGEELEKRREQRTLGV